MGLPGRTELARWALYINTYRLPVPGVTRWHFSGAEAYGSWGNVLSTQHGCVYAEAYVVDKDGEGPHARTTCIQPVVNAAAGRAGVCPFGRVSDQAPRSASAGGSRAAQSAG